MSVLHPSQAWPSLPSTIPAFPSKKHSKQPFQNQQDVLHKLVQVKLGLTTANAFFSEAGLRNLTLHKSLTERGAVWWDLGAVCEGSGKGGNCSTPDFAPHMNTLGSTTSPVRQS